MFDKLKKLNLITRLTLVGATIFLGLVLVALESINTTYDLVYSGKQDKTRQLVEVTYGVIESFYKQQEKGLITESEAKRRAIETVKLLRYDQTEYFWINDLGTPIPKMIMHPTIPELDGKILDSERFNKAVSAQDVNAQSTIKLNNENLFVTFNAVVNRSGHGYVEYMWPKAILGGGVTEELYRKLSYVKKFEPWGWVIGSGIYIDDVEDIFKSHLSHSLILAILSIFMIIVISWVIRKSILDEFDEEQAHIVQSISNVSSSDLMIYDIGDGKEKSRRRNQKNRP